MNLLSRQLRRKLTEPERLVWQNLKNRQLDGLKFRRQHPIGFYIVDFVCLERKLVIELCEESDFEAISEIVNDAARAYRGVIPADCWKKPYMPRDELRHEIDSGVRFWGYQENGQLAGVMGWQNVADVTLIRHAYVRSARRNRGIGGKLLAHLKSRAERPLLVGTWAAAVWAIAFYEKRGFQLVSPEDKDRLLRKYWSIPERQIETSVVLAQRDRFAVP